VSGIFDYLARLFRSVAFWVVVLPWQQALRVRAGRHVRLLSGGIYLKLPVLDVVQIESVRRRTSMVPVQTLSTADGMTVVVSAVIGYAIGDLEKLYRSLHHAEDTITQTAQGIIAEEVFGLRREEIDPAKLARLVNCRLVEAFTPYGLCQVTLYVTDFSFMRAIRLIQDQRWFHGRALDTQGATGGGDG
jgi:hypothetical protein